MIHRIPSRESCRAARAVTHILAAETNLRMRVGDGSDSAVNISFRGICRMSAYSSIRFARSTGWMSGLGRGVGAGTMDRAERVMEPWGWKLRRLLYRVGTAPMVDRRSTSASQGNAARRAWRVDSASGDVLRGVPSKVYTISHGLYGRTTNLFGHMSFSMGWLRGVSSKVLLHEPLNPSNPMSEMAIPRNGGGEILGKILRDACRFPLSTALADVVVLGQDASDLAAFAFPAGVGAFSDFATGG